MADNWYRLNLGDAMLAETQLFQLRKDFLQYLQATPETERKQLYTRHESKGSLHCELIAYLTPDCRDFACQKNAMACPPPCEAGLSLCKLADDQDTKATMD